MRQVAVPGGCGRDADVQRALERGARLGLRVRPDLDGRRRDVHEHRLHGHDDETNPDALPTAKENVPGFTGFSGGWKAADVQPRRRTRARRCCSRSGRSTTRRSLGEIALVPPGFWVDDVTVGGTLISDGSSLAGWQSFTEMRPNTVAGYTVYDRQHRDRRRAKKITVKRLKLTSDFRQGRQRPEVRRQEGRLRRRDRLLRRPVRDEHPVRAVQAHGQRRRQPGGQ